MLLEPMMEPQASKVLVAELVRLIQQNDTKGAERLLSEAISEGTLASLVIDQLHNPGLLAFLNTVKAPEIQPSPVVRADPAPDGALVAAKIAELWAVADRQKATAEG